MTSLVGKKIHHYMLIRPIGHGGVASVYLAHDMKNDRHVALKILSPAAMDERVRVRFQREAKLLFDLNHPNIVQVLDYGLFDQIPFLVLPYFDHGTLKDRLEKGPLSLKEGARIIGQLASALQYAHDEGIIHRDVKPSNVLFDKDGNAMLADFGFAHLISGSVSLTGSALVGTPSYMSPEQIQGATLSPQVDQYALGVILYEISTGSLPFEAETPVAVAVKHATDPLPRPSIVNPNLPAPVERVIIKSLAKDPVNRFNSIQEMNDAFQNALLASIDASTGKIKAEALIRDPITIEEPRPQLPTEQFARERERKRRYLLLGGLLIILLACPLSVWASVNLFPQWFGREQVAYADATLIYQAVLQTANAQSNDDLYSPDQINTAVALTMQAVAQNGESTNSPADTPPTGGTPATDATMLAGSGTTVAPPANSNTPSPTTGSSGPGSTSTPTNPATATSPPAASPTVTHTPSPTPTFTLTATATQLPTQTPVPVDPCTLISIGGFYISNKDVHWVVYNNNPGPVVATGANISWPAGNDSLRRVKVGGAEVWNGIDTESPSSVSLGSTSISSSAELEFHFQAAAESGGYSLSVSFSNGCNISP